VSAETHICVLDQKRRGEEGRMFLRYRSFHGNRGIAVEGYTFTVKPLYRKSINLKVTRRWKDPLPRQMFCTDIEIDADADAPEKAFVEAWNQLVENNEMLLQRSEGKDVLQVYCRNELIGLIQEYGYIESMPYELMLKTLGHIEIWEDGSIVVHFLTNKIKYEDKRKPVEMVILNYLYGYIFMPKDKEVGTCLNNCLYKCSFA
jgi:site-specific DNA recombinase